MADEKKTVKAGNVEAAPKKTTAKSATDDGAKATAAKKPAVKAELKEEKPAVKAAAEKKEAAAKPVAKTEAKEAKPAVKAAVPAEKKAKPAQKKGAELIIVNNRVVAQSKAPLYNAQHKQGTRPYTISKEEVKVTLVKSTIGSIVVHKRTVEALGLKKIGQSKTFKKSPALDGMLFRVRHLIKVEQVK